MKNNSIYWKPSKKEIITAQITKFIGYINQKHNLDLKSYSEIYEWSISQKLDFWPDLFCFLKLPYEGSLFPATLNPGSIIDSSWFPNAKVNFAETFLNKKIRGSITYIDENLETKTISPERITREILALSSFFRDSGIDEKSTIVCISSNRYEAVISLISTILLGARWSICSPDLGIKSVLDRFDQLKPNILIAGSIHQYNGKEYDSSDKLVEICNHLPSISSLIELGDNAIKSNLIRPGINKVTYTSIVRDNNAQSSIDNLQYFPFDHPSIVVFTSGSTGKPKALVHSFSAVTLQLAKEINLQYGLKAGDNFLYYTNTSWNMWYWSIAALTFGCNIFIYDGSPFYGQGDHLLQIAEKHNLNALGISPPYIDKLDSIYKSHNYKPPNLNALRVILSTGSPLTKGHFLKIRKLIKPNIRVSSISGGTDIMTCFVSGSEILPVELGKIQCPSLGMDVGVFNENNEQVYDQIGELSCKSSFPSRPLGILNDVNKEKYKYSYFRKSLDIWSHGDISIQYENKSFEILGRLDNILKPNGIRIGSAEIYDCLAEINKIQDSLVTTVIDSRGQEQLVLFIVTGYHRVTTEIPEDLALSIKSYIKHGLSHWHLPRIIVNVPEIAYGLTGKLFEVGIKNYLNKNQQIDPSSVSNPNCIRWFIEAKAIIDPSLKNQ